MGPYAYQLPVRILLDTMRTLQETTSLRATCSITQQGQTLDALIEIVLERGEVLSCEIRLLQTGACVAQGEAAFHLLAHVGVLDWQIMPRQPLVSTEGSLPLSPPVPGLIQEGKSITIRKRDVPLTVPKQAAPVNDTRVASLSPKGRQVFLLSNGARSCEDIAHLLGLSGESIQQVMRTLSEQQLIIWQAPSS